MTTLLPTKRRIGKLAQARRPREAVIERREVPLFYQAIDRIDGWTYPSLGTQLILYSKTSAQGTLKMSREVHVASAGAKRLILHLNKKGGA